MIIEIITDIKSQIFIDDTRCFPLKTLVFLLLIIFLLEFSYVNLMQE